MSLSTGGDRRECTWVLHRNCVAARRIRVAVEYTHGVFGASGSSHHAVGALGGRLRLCEKDVLHPSSADLHECESAARARDGGRTNGGKQFTCSVEASTREKPSWIELPFHSVATGELTTVTWVTALPLTSTAEKTIGARSYGWSYGTP